MTYPNRIEGREPIAPIPPDPEGLNDDRAAWAGDAIDAFARTTGVDDPDDAVSDLIADLRHWCDRNGVEFEEAVRRAAHHYETETSEGV